MRALEGKKILVTRPAEQAQALVDELEKHGANCLLMPVIEIVPVGAMSDLDKAVSRLDKYDWIVFTSVNGVAAVAERTHAIPERTKIAGIGPATCAAIGKRFRSPDAMPTEFRSEAIAPAMGNVEKMRILLPRANIAGQELAIELRSRGAEVDEVAAYRIEPSSQSELPCEVPDFITVTSSSAVRATVGMLDRAGMSSWRTDVPWVCIGPVTAAAAGKLQCNVAASASEYTIAGLVEAILHLTETGRVNA